MRLHKQGVAPSEVDRRLGLPAGTAHDAIVMGWRLEAEARREAMKGEAAHG